MATVEIHGPFFSPGADIVTRVYVNKMEADIADEAERQVHVLGSASFRYVAAPPTGQWHRSITNRATANAHVIHDSDIVYGAWLEGIGSRNFPVTRFKGYSIFRKTTRAVDDRAVRIATPTARKLCEVLNR